MNTELPRFRTIARAPVVAYDRESLAVGLARLVPDLSGRAVRLAKNSADADDLVQDTVERALLFSSQYQPGTNLRAWAQQILFSVFVTRYRRQRRERRALRILATDPCVWTRSESFAPPDAMPRLARRTEQAIHSLPPGFRSVVSLVDMGDRSYREAAIELGLPLGTVMSRLHRGRKMLATKLEEGDTGSSSCAVADAFWATSRELLAQPARDALSPSSCACSASAIAMTSATSTCASSPAATPCASTSPIPTPSTSSRGLSRGARRCKKGLSGSVPIMTVS